MKETLKDSPYFPLYILYSKFLTLLATLKVDGTSFPDAGSLVTTRHVTREI